MKRSCAVFVLALAVVSTALQAQIRLSIPDTNWHLWLDTAAAWKQDSLVLLTDSAGLSTLPHNVPTGGWGALDNGNAIGVTLPSTVEEHYWGVRGKRPYANGEYAFETEDSTVQNGNYLGVSWWWCDVNIPKSFAGKHVVLDIRGARLKAEVFFNQELVGYNILTELPFTCDVSRAIRPGGMNRLAVRITNPGGRLDWVDTELMRWGTTGQQFHKSHGFGGLDRGLELRALDPVHIEDAWVLNTPRMREIESHVIVRNLTQRVQNVRLNFEIVSADAAHIHLGAVLSQSRSVRVRASGVDTVVVRLRADTADLWTLETPVLYRLQVRASTAAARAAQRFQDSRDVTFGFRWFDAEGITQNAQLVFNGRRIRLVSAISWGFWGVNGLWPTKELAEREVSDAKAFGLNCLQFHRNVGKTEVLDAQDRLGLLRYMEPGGGQTAFGDRYSLYAPSPTTLVDPSGANGDAQTFAERYMEEKIIRMVRAHRSHPSLIMYAIQNEIHPDLHNPRIFRILRRIHEEDPSRIVVLKSGFPSGKPSTNQAWMKPYSNAVMFDSGTAYTGWWDDHTVGGPGVWRDEFYKGPDDFTHRSTNDREIVMWGEMLGAAVPDNHSGMVDYL
ncbi:MAG TPA: glycoside hydrolase, partial [Bacteroidota bacterium]|nr:glycoside hydrolase [Bacteroidota bacterium]